MGPEERRWCRGSLQKKLNTYSSALLASLVPGVEKVTIIFIGLECVQPPEDDRVGSYFTTGTADG